MVLQQFKRFRVVFIATVFLTGLLAPIFIGAQSASAASVTCPAGADRTWIGGTSDAWTTDSNWSPATTPTSSQTACIGLGTNQPHVTSSVTVASVSSAAGSYVTINTGGNLTTNASSTFNNLVVDGGTYTQAGSGSSAVDASFLFNGGTLAGTNGLGVYGTTTLATTATKNIAQDFYLFGPTNWTGGDIASTSGVGLHINGAFTSTTPSNRQISTQSPGALIIAGSFTRAGGGSNYLAGATQVTSTGSITSSGAGNVIAGLSSPTFTNAGTIQAVSNGILDLRGTYTQSGASALLKANSGSQILVTNAAINGGTVSGQGTIQGDVTNSGGTVSVGDSASTAGTLSITGNYSQTGGTLGVDVFSAGTTPGTNYDSLAVSGTLSVSGTSTLDIKTPSYDPTTYVADIATYTGTATGTFATITDDLPNGTWTADYGTSPLTITLTSVAPTPTVTEPAAAGTGYWLTGAEGKIYNFGSAKTYGSPSNTTLNQPVVGFSPTTTGAGYYVAAKDGGVFAYGDAKFAGSLGSQKINQPVVSITTNPTGPGYWLVASDGGVFAFGGAPFYGSTGSLKLNKPVVSLVPTPTGKGYWLVASDGGVFSFGDAAYKGSLGDKALNAPIVGGAADASTGGYWLVASDGGVFSFGGATYEGSAASLKLKAPIVNIRANANGTGYYLFGADGGVFAFGTAPFYGVPGPALGKAVVS